MSCVLLSLRLSMPTMITSTQKCKEKKNIQNEETTRWRHRMMWYNSLHSIHPPPFTQPYLTEKKMMSMAWSLSLQWGKPFQCRMRKTRNPRWPLSKEEHQMFSFLILPLLLKTPFVSSLSVLVLTKMLSSFLVFVCVLSIRVICLPSQMIIILGFSCLPSFRSSSSFSRLLPVFPSLIPSDMVLLSDLDEKTNTTRQRKKRELTTEGLKWPTSNKAIITEQKTFICENSHLKRHLRKRTESLFQRKFQRPQTKED